jgi:two-component system, NarL family, sensor kinase
MHRFIVIFLFAPLFCFGQTKKIDSLSRLLSNTSDQDIRINIAFDLCEQDQSMSTESLFRYSAIARQIATSKNDLSKMAMAEYYRIICLIKEGLLDSALRACNSQLRKLSYNGKIGRPYIKLSIQKGHILIRLNKYKEALEQFYHLLNEAEKHNDIITQVKTIINIGWVNMEMGQDRVALKWFNMALIREGDGDYIENNTNLFTNMAASYCNLNQYDSAEYYIKKAVAVCRKVKDLESLANALAVQASIFVEIKKVAQAEAPLTEALGIRRQIGDPFYIVSDMMELSNYYAHNKQTEKGIKICLEGIAIAQKNNLDSKLLILYWALAENYKVAGLSGKYEETLEKIISVKDSVYTKNSSEALAEIQTKYEVQKKQNKIDQQNYELAKARYLFIGLLVILIFGIVFSLILFRQNKKKQQLKLQMIVEEDKLMRKIEVASGKEKERKRIAAELHDNLGGQLTYITSNIDFILEAPVSLSEQEKKKQLGKINETAHHTIADLRETIWALNKETMGIDELADKLKVYVMNQLDFNSTVHLEVKEDILQRTILSSVETLHVFRIFQEAIQNAVKHSGADTIILSIKTNSRGAYTISLVDNGKGFEQLITYAGHYGLENMKERAGQIPAVLQIISEKGKGTTVSLAKEYSANELL